MRLHNVSFLLSNTDYTKCPKPNIPEVAFIGRSNVGKSSLINAMANHKNLAKTSGKPGKTQTINHFSVNNKWYLVDLPGYGYAKVSKVNREKFHKINTTYLTKRENLVNTFVLIDSRLPLQKLDLEFMLWMGEEQLPFSIVYTKTDKLRPKAIENRISAIEKEILTHFVHLPPNFLTSAEKKKGIEELINYIHQLVL